MSRPVRRRGFARFAASAGAAFGAALFLLAPAAPAQDDADDDSKPARQTAEQVQAEEDAAAERAAADAKALAKAKSKYKSARQALELGLAQWRADAYKEARGPLEAAHLMILEGLDPEKRPPFELRSVRRGLFEVYAELNEPALAFEMGEWLVRDSSGPLQSLTARSVLALARTQENRDLLRARFEAALEENPDDGVALMMLANVAGLDGDPVQAAEYVARLAELDRDADGEADPTLRVARARLLERSRDYEAAAAEYDRLAAEAEGLGEDAPQTFGVTQTAANLSLKAAQNWLKAQRRDEAAKAAALADRLGDAGLNDPHPYYFHDWLGDVWVNLDRPEKAIPHFRTAAESTHIEGYKKSSWGALAAARAAVAEQEAEKAKAEQAEAERAKAEKAAARKARKAAKREAKQAAEGEAAEEGGEEVPGGD